MGSLSSTEQAAVERAAAEPMLDQVEAWAAVNSGSRNLAGLGTVAAMLADAFAALPGEIALSDAERRSRRSTPAGSRGRSSTASNLHLRVRPEAPVQLLLTGHMDTVFGADHPFQRTQWLRGRRARRAGRRRHEGRHRGDARGAEGGRGEPAPRRARL